MTAGALFLHRQRATPNPMINITLFRTRWFNVPLLIDALATFAMVGFSLFNWQFMQLVLGMSPLKSALWSLPTFLVMPVGIALAAGMAPRVGKPRVMTAGLLVAAAGYVGLTLIRPDSGILHLVCALTVVSLGIAGVAAIVTDVILSAAPPERAGVASSLAETSAEFGGALGIAILGSIGTAVYRAQMGSSAPANLTPEQLASAEATLGGAIDTARTLPAGAAEALRNAAFDAFIREPPDRRRAQRGPDRRRSIAHRPHAPPRTHPNSRPRPCPGPGAGPRVTRTICIGPRTTTSKPWEWGGLLARGE